MFSWSFLIWFFFKVEIEERHCARVAVCSLYVPLVEDEVVLVEQLRGLSRYWDKFLCLSDVVDDYLAHIVDELLSV